VSFEIITCGDNALAFVDHLQRKNADALSFYPMSAFQREIQKGRIYIGVLNGQPCGYIYRGAFGDGCPVHQVCIEYDIRLQLWGAALVKAIEADATEANCYHITLRCGFDIPANGFWESLGYSVIAVAEGGARRKRRLNIWRKYLRPVLFLPDTMPPERGEQDASEWVKNGNTGVSRFARPKRTLIFPKANA
jgi:hypothetical protein